VEKRRGRRGAKWKNLRSPARGARVRVGGGKTRGVVCTSPFSPSRLSTEKQPLSPTRYGQPWTSATTVTQGRYVRGWRLEKCRSKDPLDFRLLDTLPPPPPPPGHPSHPLAFVHSRRPGTHVRTYVRTYVRTWGFFLRVASALSRTRRSSSSPLTLTRLVSCSFSSSMKRPRSRVVVPFHPDDGSVVDATSNDATTMTTTTTTTTKTETRTANRVRYARDEREPRDGAFLSGDG